MNDRTNKRTDGQTDDGQTNEGMGSVQVIGLGQGHWDSARLTAIYTTIIESHIDIPKRLKILIFGDLENSRLLTEILDANSPRLGVCIHRRVRRPL